MLDENNSIFIIDFGSITKLGSEITHEFKNYKNWFIKVHP